MAYKIYIATPINDRPEESLSEKLEGAAMRIGDIRHDFIGVNNSKRGKFEYDDNKPFRRDEFVMFYSTFEINTPPFVQRSEAECLANCVRLIMECDAIIIDKGLGIPSKGMAVEEFVARTYGKTIIYYNHKD